MYGYEITGFPATAGTPYCRLSIPDQLRRQDEFFPKKEYKLKLPTPPTPQFELNSHKYAGPNPFLGSSKMW